MCFPKTHLIENLGKVKIQALLESGAMRQGRGASLLCFVWMHILNVYLIPFTCLLLPIISNPAHPSHWKVLKLVVSIPLTASSV